MDMLRLSIIIPAYRVEHLLRRCAESCERQDIPGDEYEVIIVDDGSPDGTLAVARQLAEEYPNITVLTQENGGVSTARNVALGRCRGRYVMLADADDYIDDRALGRVLAHAEEERLDVCFYYAWIESAQGVWRESLHPYPSPGRILTGGEYIARGGHVGSACMSLFRRECIGEIRFDGQMRYSEDVDFMTRTLLRAGRVGEVRQCVYRYCYNGASATKSHDEARQREKLLAIATFAHRLAALAVADDCDARLRGYLRRWSRSLVAGVLLQSLMDGSSRRFARDFIDHARSLGLYPVCGRCLSWKSTVAAWLMSREWLYRRMLRWKKQG